MDSLVLLKIIRALSTPAAKHNRMQPKQLSAKGDAGFTMIEMIVVVIIIAVLSAIAAPGWMAFTNQQRVSKVNDALFSAIQQAQSEAKLKKLSYSVSFKTDTDKSLKVAIYQQTTPAPSTLPWQALGKNLDVRPGQVLLITNVTSANTAGTTLAAVTDSTNPTITFDYMGALSSPQFNPGSAKGLIVAVAPENNSTAPFGGTKRCVTIKTFLGAMQVGKNTECNPS